ncbi:hypothetical protein D0Z03_001931 [Geotrichum reessii]|nr:hypothetical protein D0Z03_001931 [Galactomyces reessii]
MLHIWSAIVVLASFLNFANAFYLPGVAPTDYDLDQQVPLLVNTLTPVYDSSIRKLHSVIAYDYYYKSFNFCKPKNGPKKQSESLGSILFGDRIFDSPFELYMLKNESCKTLCSSSYDSRSALFVNRRIRMDYDMNWLVDGLPAASQVYSDNEPASQDGDKQSQEFYSAGFSLGFTDEEGNPFLNNHYDITIEYHQTRQGKYRVVGVIVDPYSRDNQPDSDGNVKCDAETLVSLKTDDTTSVSFTYSVKWIPSNTVWATRWDKYLHVYDPSIHWFSLINSIIIVVFLTGVVSAILIKTLRKDIARYNEIDLSEDIHEDSGWKLPKSLRLVTSIVLSGILPFGAISVELYYIYNSLWLHKIYYMFGFLFLCFGVMILTTATVTILLTYFMLCAENYHWQWRSFFAAGAASFYVFLYALIYLASKFSLGSFTSYVLYLGYSLLMAFMLFVLTGSIGFISTFFFTRKIYGSIKVD